MLRIFAKLYSSGNVKFLHQGCLGDNFLVIGKCCHKMDLLAEGCSCSSTETEQHKSQFWIRLCLIRCSYSAHFPCEQRIFRKTNKHSEEMLFRSGSLGASAYYRFCALKQQWRNGERMQGIKLERGFGAKHTVFKKHLKKRKSSV